MEMAAQRLPGGLFLCHVKMLFVSFIILCKSVFLWRHACDALEKFAEEGGDMVYPVLGASAAFLAYQGAVKDALK